MEEYVVTNTFCKNVIKTATPQPRLWITLHWWIFPTIISILFCNKWCI